MQPQPRYDIYEVIHKALRARLSQTLTSIGKLDVEDDYCVGEAVEEVRTTLAIMRGHLQSENEFVHAAMEARAPGSTRQVAGEHEHHEEDIAVLDDACDALLAAAPSARAARAGRLYFLLELFLRDNLTHMRYEEDHHNAVLWAAYSDEEILAIEAALVAAIPPQKKALLLPCMVPAVPTRDRVKLLRGLQAGMPPEVFAGIYASVASLLDAGERQRLDAAMRAPAPLQAVA